MLFFCIANNIYCAISEAFHIINFCFVYVYENTAEHHLAVSSEKQKQNKTLGKNTVVMCTFELKIKYQRNPVNKFYFIIR